jgi:hypothetical protein
MAKMSQGFGAEMNRKNRSHTRSGLVRFFQFIYAQKITADGPFQFRISGLEQFAKRSSPQYRREKRTGCVN